MEPRSLRQWVPRGLALGALALALLAGCAHLPRPSRPMASVRGSVTYRERVTLPADALLKVELVEALLEDAPATVIAETTVRSAGRQPPLGFELRYDPARVLPARFYALRASLRAGGHTLFASEHGTRVITHGYPGYADLVLQKARAEGEPAPSGLIVRAEQIRATLGDLRPVPGVPAPGDSVANWKAYYAGRELRCIVEKLEGGERGTVENEYFFENGSLFGLYSRASRDTGAAGEGRERTLLRLGYDEAGNPTEQSKTVDGRQVTIEPGEIVEARRHALALQQDIERREGGRKE